MKFATIGHLIDETTLDFIPKEWIYDKYIISPEIKIENTSGYIIALKLTAKQIMGLPRTQIRNEILNATVFAQNELNIDLIQLGALTTSVTSGGKWILEQNEYSGYINHGDAYTASVACQAVLKTLEKFNKNPKEQKIAIVGAYGIIGEVVSKILVPKFFHSILIGRREEKLQELSKKLKGSFETTINLDTLDADVLLTATSHPTSLLDSSHLKKETIVVDVSQPPNLTREVCNKRMDICRIDGGFVDFVNNVQIPGLPPGKILSCIAEVIMQAMENDKKNYVGSIDLEHLYKTEKLAKKYGFTLNELTNFGNPI